MQNSNIINFYLNKIPNNDDFYLSDIHKFSFEEFESNHNYIQWLFPTDQKSNFNKKSELLIESDIKQFKSNKKLIKNFIKSLQVVLYSYRIHLQINNDNEFRWMIKYWFDNEDETRNHNFDWWNSKEIKNWITPKNHNFLRVSRILRSCKLILGQEFAESLFNFLVPHIWLQFHEIIGMETLKHWREAVFDLKN